MRTYHPSTLMRDVAQALQAIAEQNDVEQPGGLYTVVIDGFGYSAIGDDMSIDEIVACFNAQGGPATFFRTPTGALSYTLNTTGTSTLSGVHVDDAVRSLIAKKELIP